MKKNISENLECFATEPLPWKRYWERKLLVRKRLRCNYTWLIASTLIFGGVIIGLRLQLKSSKLDQYNSNKEALAVLENSQPTEAELGQLVGEHLDDGLLAKSLWGQSRMLAGSDEMLTLFYFPQAEVYLLRRNNGYVVYASKNNL